MLQRLVNDPETTDSGLLPRPDGGTAPRRERRWKLIRDLLVFQGKLFLDGLRDVLLAPAALLTGLIAVWIPGPRTEKLFYDVLRLGNHLEHWINLFGAVRRKGEPDPDDTRLDRFLAHVEKVLREQHRKGGLTRKAQERVDSVLDSLDPTKK